MKKNLGLIPTIYERRDNLNIIIEKRVFNFLSEIFKNYNIIILNDIKKLKLDLIVSLGGNTLCSFKKNKSTLYRRKIDIFYLNKSIKYKIPFLGICYGAQSLKYLFNLKLKRKFGHRNTKHKIFLKNGKTQIINSYHDYSIIDLDQNFSKIAWCKDGSVEAFKHNKYQMLGIMWHPERYRKIKKFDLELIKKYL